MVGVGVGLALLVAAVLLVLVRDPAPAEAAQSLPGQGFLPDNRGWEMVSPASKAGGDVSAVSSRTHVSTDGNHVSFMSLTSFPNATGATAAGAEYVANRAPDGWRTHGTTPPVGPFAFPIPASPAQYQGLFSSDLEQAVFLAPPTPSMASESVADVANLYLRDDLTSDGPGDYTLLSDCPGCSPLPPEGFATHAGIAFAGASDDFGHIIFESRDNLTGETTGNAQKVYEWVRETGTVRLAGVLPDSACGSPPCPADSSAAGNGAGIASIKPGLYYNPATMHAISADGSTIFFTAAPDQRPFPNFRHEGDLYARIDGSQSVKVNGSEPATFLAATKDGSQVFFATTESLVPEDSNSGEDVYRFDLDAAPGDEYTLISTGAAAASSTSGDRLVVGLDGDGSYVYFLSAHDAGPSATLYVWHDGSVREIASAGSSFVSRTSLGQSESAFNNSNVFRLSADGSRAVFVTADNGAASSAGYDNEPVDQGTCESSGIEDIGCQEVYLYDFAGDVTACLSCGDPDVRPTDDSSISAFVSPGPNFLTPDDNNAILADGSKVFFSTNKPLVARDSNGHYDAYQYDVGSGEYALISSGQEGSDSHFLNASPSGSDVLFTTRERLVGIDTDASVDLYDARIGGGIAGQNPPAPNPPCEGDECQGDHSPPPAADESGSTSTGPGNIEPVVDKDCGRFLEKALNKLERAQKASKKKAKKLRRQARKLKKKAKKCKQEANS